MELIKEGVWLLDNSSAGVPAVIHLQTVTIQDGEQSDYVLDVEGRLVQIGETLYLRYQEMNEEEDSPATVTLKILPNGDVQLTRNGDNRSRLFLVMANVSRHSTKRHTAC